MSRRGLRAASCALTALMLAGCTLHPGQRPDSAGVEGGAGLSNACLGVDAGVLADCGGEVDGDWEVVGACLEPSSAGFEPDSDVCVLNADRAMMMQAISGPWTIDLGGVGSYDMVITQALSVLFNPQCMVEEGSAAGRSAEEHCQWLGEELQSESGVSGQCFWDTSGCSCEYVYEATATDSFHWYWDAGVFVIDSDTGGGVTRYDICESGDLILGEQSGASLLRLERR